MSRSRTVNPFTSSFLVIITSPLGRDSELKNAADFTYYSKDDYENIFTEFKVLLLTEFGGFMLFLYIFHIKH